QIIRKAASRTILSGIIDLPSHFTLQRMPPMLKVLVVDDDQDNATTLAEVIRLHGHNSEAVTEDDPLVAILKAEPDVAILDLVMRKTSGFELAKAIRGSRLPRSVELVALTGHDSREFRARARACGIGRYLVKPADPETLETLLAEVAETRR